MNHDVQFRVDHQKISAIEQLFHIISFLYNTSIIV